MLKWMLALFLAIVVVGLLQPKLARWLRLGTLPGDVEFTLRGRRYVFPFASAILFSLLAGLIGRLL